MRADSAATLVAPVQVLVPAASQLGECALWCEREQALYWADIDRGLLSRRRANGQLSEWQLPAPLGCFALTERAGMLLLGLGNSIALFDLVTGRLGPRLPVPGFPDREGIRINDGRCDPQGRFVFGLFNPAGAALGRFYRVDAALNIETLPLPPAAIANGLAFYPDFGPHGSRMYFTDSASRQIQVVDYHADGRLGEPTAFATMAPDDGEPDGAAVDANGDLWVALWGAGCVAHFDGASGRELERLMLPSSHPTCPAFGGPALDRLYVSSARKALHSPAQQAAEPLAGAVYALQPGVRGQPENRFRTALRP